MSGRQWWMIAVLSCLWGGTFFFHAIAVRELPTLTIVVVRLAGAAVALGLIVGVLITTHGLRPPADVPWTDYAVMGLLANALPFVLIVAAQHHIPSGLAAVLNAATPVFVVLVAHLAGVERATVRHLTGVMLGLAGVAILIGPAAWTGDRVGVLGMLAMLAATLSYGFAALWGRRFREVPPMITATGQLVCSAAMVLPLALVVDRPWLLPLPGVPTLLALAGLALLSTALAFVIFFDLMAKAGPLNAMLVTLLVPVSATLLGVLVLGEALTLRQIAGGVMIATGLAILDGRIVNRWQDWRIAHHR